MRHEIVYNGVPLSIRTGSTFIGRPWYFILIYGKKEYINFWGKRKTKDICIFSTKWYEQEYRIHNTKELMDKTKHALSLMEDWYEAKKESAKNVRTIINTDKSFLK